MTAFRIVESRTGLSVQAQNLPTQYADISQAEIALRRFQSFRAYEGMSLEIRRVDLEVEQQKMLATTATSRFWNPLEHGTN